MDDLRLRVSSLENLGVDEAFRASTQYRSEYPLGYFDRVAGDVRTYESVNLTGEVVRVNRNLGYILVRAAGGEHRVYLDQSFVQINGRRAGLNDIRVGDRVAVSGRTIR